MKSEFVEGRKFKVIRDGARLFGWRSVPGGQQGWGQTLKVGDQIECLGRRKGFGSDPGYGVSFKSRCSQRDSAFDVTFTPSVGGAFDYKPAPGFLEAVEAA